MIVPPGALIVMRRMLAAEDDDAELVHEEGAGWWLSHDRISAATCLWMVRHVVISLTSELGAQVERWELNEHGREAARTGRVPDELVKLLRKMHR